MGKLRLLVNAIGFIIFLSTSAQSKSEASNKKEVSKKAYSIRLNSLNVQPVGLVGGNVSAELIISGDQNKNKKFKRDCIEFSDNVLVNSYGRKGCITSSCVMEVRFDQGKLLKYRIYESKQDSYLRRIYLSDSDFKARALNARDINVKIRFADSIDGVFVFKNM